MNHCEIEIVISYNGSKKIFKILHTMLQIPQTFNTLSVNLIHNSCEHSNSDYETFNCNIDNLN